MIASPSLVTPRFARSHASRPAPWPWIHHSAASTSCIEPKTPRTRAWPRDLASPRRSSVATVAATNALVATLTSRTSTREGSRGRRGGGGIGAGAGGVSARRAPGSARPRRAEGTRARARNATGREGAAREGRASDGGRARSGGRARASAGTRASGVAGIGGGGRRARVRTRRGSGGRPVVFRERRKRLSDLSKTRDDETAPFSPRGKSLRTKTNQLSVRRLPLPPRVCGRAICEMTTRFSALTRFNTAGCSARPTAHSPRAGVGSGSPPVPSPARRRPRASVSARARALGPRRRLSRAFGSAPVSNPDPPLRRAPIRRDGPIATRSWIRRVGRARGSLPFLAAMRRFRAVPSSSSAREKRAADSKPVSGRATPTSVLDQHPRPRRARRARQTIQASRARARPRPRPPRAPRAPARSSRSSPGSGARTAGW